jgi:hypothetical protein
MVQFVFLDVRDGNFSVQWRAGETGETAPLSCFRDQKIGVK